MIKLKYNVDNVEDVEEEYLVSILKRVYSKEDTINKYLNIDVNEDLNINSLFEKLKFHDQNFNFLFEKYNLKDIILMKADKIPLFIKEIESKLNLLNNKNFIKKIEVLFNYSKFQGSVITPLFNKYVSIRTCYYCNRSFIFNIEKNKNVIKNNQKELFVTYQLDHFYEQSSYPYLSLCLHNLIPSCNTCNSVIKNNLIKKKEDDFFNKNIISPCSNNFNFDKYISFKTLNNEGEISLDLNDFEIKLLPREEFYDEEFKSYEKYIEFFHLNEIYSEHKNILIEMKKKVDKYPDALISRIVTIFEGKYTADEIKKDLFSEHMYEDDLSKYPLSKLIKDFSIELGLKN